MDGQQSLREATGNLPDVEMQDSGWITDAISFFSNLGSTVSEKFREIAGNIIHEGSTAIVGATDNGTRLPDMQEVVDGIQGKAEEITGIDDIGEMNLPSDGDAAITPVEQEPSPVPEVPQDTSAPQVDASSSHDVSSAQLPVDSTDASQAMELGNHIPGAADGTVLDWIASNGIIGAILGNCSLSEAAGTAFVSLVVFLIVAAVFASFGGFVKWLLCQKLLPERARLVPIWATYPGYIVANLARLMAAFIVHCKINRVELLPMCLREKLAKDDKQSLEAEKKALSGEQLLGYVAFSPCAKKEKVKDFQAACCAIAPTVIGVSLSVLLVFLSCLYAFPWWGMVLVVYSVVSLLLNCGMSAADAKQMLRSPLSVTALLLAVFLFFPIDTGSLTAVIF